MEEMMSEAPLMPPADVPEIQRGNWLTLPEDDMVTRYLAIHHWDQSSQPATWQTARLSSAAHIYREQPTGWMITAKFYSVKTGGDADKHARNEMDRIHQARTILPVDGDLRVVRPLAVWRGILFQEYVDGLTLEDTIAVRRSRPGNLTCSLTLSGQFLAAFHANSSQPGSTPDISKATAYAHKVVNDLARWGVLQGNQVSVDGLSRLINRWSEKSSLAEYQPTWVHGDATTTNFIFPPKGGLAAVDWERFDLADPASDLGRLMAEVSHSITQHGGDIAEAAYFTQHLLNTYRDALPDHWYISGLLDRARFYQASSLLRIARNGWVPRLERMGLVLQAMALLA